MRNIYAQGKAKAMRNSILGLYTTKKRNLSNAQVKHATVRRMQKLEKAIVATLGYFLFFSFF